MAIEKKELRDIRQEVTDRLVAAMEKGELPWRRPWRDSERAMGLPKNASTDKSYNGGNRLILLSAQMDKGYQDNRWLTFKQAQALGGSVQKGEKGTAIEYWDKLPFWRKKGIGYEHQGRPVKLDKLPTQEYPTSVHIQGGKEVPTKDMTVIDPEGKRYTWRQAEQLLSVMFCKAHTVFNVEQCKDLNIEVQNKIEDPDFGKAKHIMKGMQADGVTIKHGGNRAFYMPGRDSVTMPESAQFESHEKYIGTLLHELGHATGHPDRNNRVFGVSFGSQDYAKEELVAELTSAFVAAETGVGFEDEHHAGYLKSWLDALGNDKHELFRAAKEASKAADYLIERGREAEIGISKKGVEQEQPSIASTPTPAPTGEEREQEEPVLAAQETPKPKPRKRREAPQAGLGF